MKQLARLISDHPLALLPAKLEQIEAFLHYRAGEAAAPAYQQRPRAASQRVDNVAVVPILGTISKRIGLMQETSGGVSTDQISADLQRAVADRSVQTIVLQIDSPGGSVYGVQELAAEIFAARASKRIVAVADSLAASAAYWIGSAANEFVVTPSGEVGSIGVVAMHVDQSAALADEGVKITYIKAGENKVEGNPYEPLSPSAQDFMQSRVNEYYATFVNDVARNRGVKRSTVLSSFGQGRVYGATQAKAVGMVDRIATMADVVQGLRTQRAAHSLSGSQPGAQNQRLAAIEADIAIAKARAS